MTFNGRYRKGYMRTLKEQKREEAEARNARYRELLKADSAAILDDDLYEPGDGLWVE